MEEESKLRAVIDTSVIVCAHTSKNSNSAPSIIWRAFIEGEFSIIISPQIQKEIVRICFKRGIIDEKIEEIIKILDKKAENIAGEYVFHVLDNVDPDDNMILAAACEGDVDYIVSYDRESLLPLKHFHNIQIVEPGSFIKQLSEIKKKI